MTKKDYELIAGAIAGRVKNINSLYVIGQWDKTDAELGRAVLEDLAEFLAYDLGKANDRFDYGRFITACNVRAGQ